jgi:hypothetical protein
MEVWMSGIETIAQPEAKSDGAGGKGRPPTGTAAASSPQRRQPSDHGDWIPLRSFGPMPARLSPAGRGELTIPRPHMLAMDGGAFAFRPPGDELAPALTCRHLAYARARTALVAGDLAVIVTKAGAAVVGYVTARDVEAHHLDAGAAGSVRIPYADTAEAAEIVMVDRLGNPPAVRSSAREAA